MPTTVGLRNYPAPADTDRLRDGAGAVREGLAAVGSDTHALLTTKVASVGSDPAEDIILGVGWAAVSGYTLQARYREGLVQIRGALQWNSAQFYSVMFTLPNLPLDPIRPGQNTWLPSFVSSPSGAVNAQVLLEPDGECRLVSTYAAGTPTVGMIVPICGMFFV